MAAQSSPFWARSGFWTAVSTTAGAIAVFAQHQTPDALQTAIAAITSAWVAFFTAKTVRKSTTVE